MIQDSAGDRYGTAVNGGAFSNARILTKVTDLGCAPFFGTEEEGTEKWLNQLYSELERFFAENAFSVLDVLRGEFEGQTHAGIVKAVQRFWADRAGRPSDD